MLLWGLMASFDESKYYLGTLCKRGHNYKGTGKSLRSCSKSSACVECRRENYKNRSRPVYTIILKCQVCGKKFGIPTRRKNTAKFCSQKCHRISSINKKVLITCEYCGKKKKVNLHRKNEKFCSIKCYSASCKVTSVCDVCGKKFVRNKCDFIRVKKAGYISKYCSVVCRAKGRKVKKITVSCSWCGTVITDTVYRFRNGKRFCSLECSNKAKTSAARLYPTTCRYCSEEFFRKRADSSDFCSSSCKGKWYSRERHPNWNGKWDRKEYMKRYLRRYYQKNRHWKEAMLMIESLKDSEEREYWTFIVDASVHEKLLINDLKKEVRLTGKG